MQTEKKGFFDKLQAGASLVTAYLSGATQVVVSDEVQQHRWQQCEGCPNKVTAFSPLDMSMQPKCALCGCFLNWKIPLQFDPVESDRQGKQIHTACPIGQW